MNHKILKTAVSLKLPVIGINKDSAITTMKTRTR